MAPPQLECLKLNLSNQGVLTLTFARPGGNAMSPQLFKDWHTALTFAASSDEVKVLVQTGAGKYYSSGKDLAPTMHETFEEEMNAEMDVLEDLINTLINFPKPTIAAVNGPAIGLAVTSLAHFDFVYAVPSATFSVPFMRWGFCAEGCSSVLFPRLLGTQTSSELLLAGTTLSAKRLEAVGFLETLEAGNFLDQINKKANTLADYDPYVVKVTKDLVHEDYRKELMHVNHKELSLLRKMMMAEKSRRAIQDFIDARAAKSKQRPESVKANL